MIFEWDDFGCNHEISDMCQSHDCRDQLLRLKELRPEFKATLFAIPAEITMELLQWCHKNASWIELAVHGFGHISNYECNDWTYDQMDVAMKTVGSFKAFVPIFRAPGWQISGDCLKWLADKDWIVADQTYNNDRRPIEQRAYLLESTMNQFFVNDGKDPLYTVEAYHGHTWNVGSVGSNPNGIYEDFDNVQKLVKDAKDFQFISELFV